MQKIIIDGYFFIKGDDCVFAKETFLGLMPGEKITKIGDGRHTGCYETLQFKTYITYMGSIAIDNTKITSEGKIVTFKEKKYAFLIPEKEVEGWHLFNPPKPLYLLFVDVGDDAGLESINNRLAVFKGTFERYEETISKKTKQFADDCSEDGQEE